MGVSERMQTAGESWAACVGSLTPILAAVGGHRQPAPFRLRFSVSPWWASPCSPTPRSP